MQKAAKQFISFLLAIIMMFGFTIGVLPFETNTITADAAEIIAYQQGSSPWGSHFFGYTTSNGKKVTATVGSSACGILSLTNSVYYKTGVFLDPGDLADFALNNGYRSKTQISTNGVDPAFFKAYCETYGSQHGFYYVSSTTNASDALTHVRNGGTACYNIPGHWIAVVDYNSSSDKYLILDSAGSSSRTKKISWESKGVAWLSGDILTKKGHAYGLKYSAHLISYNEKPITIISLVEKYFPSLTDIFNPTQDDSGLSSSDIEKIQNPWNYSYPARTLKYKSPMMKGDDVRWLQASLSYLGYSCTIDGTFGPATRDQVRAYQKANELTVDGIVGQKTLSSLQRAIESKKNANSSPSTTPSSSYPTPTRLLKYTKPLHTGDDVKWLQSSLNQLINADLVIDGMYGNDTKKAVIAFQSLNGLSPDGMCGEYTRGKINELLSDSNYYPPQSSVNTILNIGYPKPTRTLKYIAGSSYMKGDDVRWLQTALRYALNVEIAVDGYYGAKTVEAVKAFQSEYGLTADGIFGSKSLAKMNTLLDSKSIITVGGSAVPAISVIEFTEKNKMYYANEESISFEFDSDTADSFQLIIRDDFGDTVYEYITEEYTLSTGLEPGYYSATVTAINDKGELESEALDFVVIDQMQVGDGAVQIRSYSYGSALSYNADADELSTQTINDHEKLWYISSKDDFTFLIYNIYSNKVLDVLDGKAVLSDVSDSESALWYMYEENGMSFIKNKNSDLTLTISSDGVVSLEPLDSSSYAQSIELFIPDRTTVMPTIEIIDATHANVSWNAVEGVDSYTIVVYDTEGVTEDGIYDIYETSETAFTVDIPESGGYYIWLEATGAGEVVVSMAIDEDDTDTDYIDPSIDLEEEEISETYFAMLIQLQRYLLNKKEYSPTIVKELDMNYDGVLNIFDLVLLKQLILES